MIWIIWLLFIVADAYWNFEEMAKLHLKIRHGLESVYRAVFAIGLAFAFDLQHAFPSSRHLTHLVWLMYALGTFFSFWLIFNLLINFFFHQPAGQVGKTSILDKLESKGMPIASIFWKTVLAWGFIYGFYNVEQL